MIFDFFMVKLRGLARPSASDRHRVRNLSSTLGLLLHLHYYERCGRMVLKMWVESKFVLRQPRYYNLLTEKKL